MTTHFFHNHLEDLILAPFLESNFFDFGNAGSGGVSNIAMPDSVTGAPLQELAPGAMGDVDNGTNIPFASLDPFREGGANPQFDVTYDGSVAWERNGGSGGPFEEESEYTVELMGGTGSFTTADGTTARVDHFDLADDRVTVVMYDGHGQPIEWQSEQVYEFEGSLSYGQHDAGLAGHTIMGSFEHAEEIKSMFGTMVEYGYESAFTIEGESFGGLSSPHLNSAWEIEGSLTVAITRNEFGFWEVEVSAEIEGFIKTDNTEFELRIEPYETLFLVEDLVDFDFSMPDVFSRGLSQMENQLGAVWESLGHFEDFLGEVLIGLEGDGWYDLYDPIPNPFDDASVPEIGWSQQDEVALF